MDIPNCVSVNQMFHRARSHIYYNIIVMSYTYNRVNRVQHCFHPEVRFPPRPLNENALEREYKLNASNIIS